MILRTLSLSLALSFGPARAADVPIQLDPALGSDAVEVQTVKNVTGTCGGAVIRVMGLSDEFVTSSFDLDAARIILRSPAGELVLGSETVISDYNSIACIENRKGEAMLVIASRCGGTVCGDKADYYVIDPRRLTFVAPLDPKKQNCDRACATRALGKRPPEF